MGAEARACDIPVSCASRPEAQLDLHGILAEEARRLLGQFLTRERARGHRVVLVICGRGLHSPLR